VTFVLLGVGFFRLDVIATEIEAVGPLLLIVPALLAAFLVRPGEHALAARILAGTGSLSHSPALPTSSPPRSSWWTSIPGSGAGRGRCRCSCPRSA
jgi:hypothetical protein